MFHFELPETKIGRLAIKLNRNGERSVKQGHPWIFDNSITKINKAGKPGDLAIIFDSTSNKVLGIGLFDPHSPIRIKMLHSDGGIDINKGFFKERIEQAYELRKPLFESDTNSYRLLFGENDGFPGLITDVYKDVVVTKIYSAIWFPYFKDILEIIVELIDPKAVVFRSSRNLQRLNLNSLKDGDIIYGELNDSKVIFEEHGIRFSADVVHGHKTGYFLDHRHNRKRVGEIAKGKHVLDVFSYAGGFSVHALVGGAKEVYSVDISGPALEMARYNAALNDFSGSHKTITGDAFEVMQDLIEDKESFDIVVIDPPSFAKQKSEIPAARKKYAQLAELGTQLTARKGMLVLASCSSRITKDEFLQINQSVIDRQSRDFYLEEVTTHDIDHPVSFPEGAYLKCGYYRFRN